MNDPNTQTMQRTLIASAVAALLVLPLADNPAVAGSSHHSRNARADHSVVTDQETVAGNAGWNDPALSDDAAHQGRMLLRQLKDVQTALKVGDTQGARHAIASAEDLAETLKPLMPTQLVTDKLRDADDEVIASGTDVAVDQMLPIYGDVATITAYTPSRAGQVDSSATKAKPKSSADPVPVATDLTSSVVYLPLLYVETKTELASKALDQSPPDTAVAKQAVNDALSSLVFSETDLELLPSVETPKAG